VDNSPFSFLLTGVVPAACDAEAGDTHADAEFRNPDARIAEMRIRRFLQIRAGSSKKCPRSSRTIPPP
jgi:hypothetical protein